MEQEHRLTKDDFRLGFDNSDLLPPYTAIYEKLRKHEAADSVSVVRCRNCESRYTNKCPLVDTPFQTQDYGHCFYGIKKTIESLE